MWQRVKGLQGALKLNADPLVRTRPVIRRTAAVVTTTVLRWSTSALPTELVVLRGTASFPQRRAPPATRIVRRIPTMVVRPGWLVPSTAAPAARCARQMLRFVYPLSVRRHALP